MKKLGTIITAALVVSVIALIAYGFTSNNISEIVNPRWNAVIMDFNNWKSMFLN